MFEKEVDVFSFTLEGGVKNDTAQGNAEGRDF